MSLENFSLTYGAQTRTLAAWGLARAKIEFKSFEVDEMTFDAPGQPFDAAPLFAEKTWVVVTNPVGVVVFVGIVTQTPASADPKKEGRDYVISGPAYFFEHLTFQMTWNIEQGVGAGQITGVLVPTLRATILIGNQSDGTTETLSQVAAAVINYVLTTAAGGGWPQPNSPGFTPFQLGSVPPDLLIPLTEVKDLTCWELLKKIFAYVPDAGTWFDYSQLVDGVPCPKFYIGRRDRLVPVSLPCYGKPITKIDLRPRADLVVPAVVVKYWQTNTIDGNSYSDIIPDIFPVNAKDPNFDNLVVDVELQPGNLSYLKQTLTTTSRPKDYDAQAGTGALVASALAWIRGRKRAPWLRGYWLPANWPAGLAPYITANPEDHDVWVPVNDADLAITRVQTFLSEDSPPLVLGSTTVQPDTGPGTAATLEYSVDGQPVTKESTSNALDVLDQELLTGSVPPWLTSGQNIYAANVTIDVTVKYLGTDKYIQSLFPASPLIGPGIPPLLTFNCPCRVTNGASETYQQPASITPSEPVPVGLAEQIYQGLSVKHWEGEVEITEQEISGVVGMGNCLNLAGGQGDAANYAAMNAQPVSITWDIDSSRSSIKVGPPKYLGAGQLTDLQRAVRGRIPTYRANEQQTGQADGNNSIDGAGHTAHAGATTAPGGGSTAQLGPIRITYGANSNGTYWCQVALVGAFLNTDATALEMLGPGGEIITNTVPSHKFNLGGNDTLWFESTVASLGASTVQIRSYGSGSSGLSNPNAYWTGGGLTENDGATPPNQTILRKVIATFVAGAKGQPTLLTQQSTTNLQLANNFQTNEAMIYPQPI